MKIRLNSGVTYQNRANIFPPVKKHKKNKQIIFDENFIYNKIHEHFSNFDLLKLNAFGDDYENYGNITLKGISYAPKKIKIDYIKKRFHEEVDKRNKKIFNFEDEDIIDVNNYSSNRKIDKYYLNKLNLPLLKSSKNRSMENIRVDNLNFNNKINQKILFNMKNNRTKNIRFMNNEKEEKKIDNNDLKNYIKIKNEQNILFIRNNISVTNKNIKMFLQTNKLEVKTNINKINHILKKNSFLRRYDQSAELNNKLNKLNKGIKKINILVSKAVEKNNEDIPQFEMRFNHLFSKFQN